MQNFNSFLVICALLATAGGVTSGYSQDTDAQAKARQALRQQMGKPSESPDGSKDSPEQAKAREALRKKSEIIQPAVSQTAAQPSSITITMQPPPAPADPQAIEKARQAVRQKLDELNNGTPDTPEIAKAREALRQKMNEVPMTPLVVIPAAASAQASKNEEKAAHAQNEAQSKAEEAVRIDSEKAEAAAQAERRAKYQATVHPGTFQPIPTPALPISNEKQQQLTELLKKYQADQLSPEEYHQARAKVLAGQ